MLYHHKGPKTLFTKMFLLQAVHILYLLKPHIILIKKLLLQFCIHYVDTKAQSTNLALFLHFLLNTFILETGAFTGVPH